MKIPLTIIPVFLIVTIASFIGMLFGGLFGYTVGSLSPELFRHPPDLSEPVSVATSLGAFGGVLCGGGLGVFAVIIQAFSSWLSSTQRSD